MPVAIVPGRSCREAFWRLEGWSKLPRSIWGIWRLANGRLERPNNRRLCRQTAGLNALTTNAPGQSVWSKLPRSIFGRLEGWSKLPRSILGIWRLANGRLERPKTDGYAGKRQASTLSQQMPVKCLVEAPAKYVGGWKAGRSCRGAF